MVARPSAVSTQMPPTAAGPCDAPTPPPRPASPLAVIRAGFLSFKRGFMIDPPPLSSDPWVPRPRAPAAPSQNAPRYPRRKPSHDLNRQQIYSPCPLRALPTFRSDYCEQMFRPSLTTTLSLTRSPSPLHRVRPCLAASPRSPLSARATRSSSLHHRRNIRTGRTTFGLGPRAGFAGKVGVMGAQSPSRW